MSIGPSDLQKRLDKERLRLRALSPTGTESLRQQLRDQMLEEIHAMLRKLTKAKP